MSADNEATPNEATPSEPKHPYDPPRIVWREPYEPMSFGVSCAKQPLNEGCSSFFTS